MTQRGLIIYAKVTATSQVSRVRCHNTKGMCECNFLPQHMALVTGLQSGRLPEEGPARPVHHEH